MDGRLDRPRARSSRSSRSPSTAASAATSAATSSSTATATCCSRRATTRTRSSPQGYTPIDEREDRNPAFDAQRSSANTNDLRGKVLRITVHEDGSYTDPRGQPLPGEGTEGTRPEIYVMGLRNPFRIEYNQVTDELYIADYSPDASTPEPAARPGRPGQVVDRDRGGELRLAVLRHRGAALRGLELRDPDLRTARSTARTRSTSRRTTPGSTELPPVDAARRLVHVHALRGVPGARDRRHRPDGRAGVPVRRQDHQGQPEAAHRVAGVLRQRAALLRVDARLHQGLLHRGRRPDADRGLPSCSSRAFEHLQNPIDIEFGPNGSLYVLNYGNGFFGNNQPGAELVRNDYLGAKGDRSPTVNVAADPDEGDASPLTVGFTTTVADPEGRKLKYAWDFDVRRHGSTRASPTRRTRTGGGRVPRHADGDRPGRPQGLRLRDLPSASGRRSRSR